MIQHLSVRNFAIIDEAEVDFHPGFTVITGETGSGKSILIQALSVALGARGTKTMVRTGAERAVVEATVDEVAYRRLISANGRVRSYIDDEPTKEPQFRQAVASLVDFHGQHEQQLIMHTASHIDYLDSFCGLEPEVARLSTIYHELVAARSQLQASRERLERARERRELLAFQQREINAVNPQDGEDVELENEYKTLSHIDELVATVNRLNQSLLEADTSVYGELTENVNALEKLARYDALLKPYIEQLQTASFTIQEVAAGLRNHLDSLDHDPQRLQEIEERLQALEGLKRKYGGSLEAVQMTRREIERELHALVNLDSEIDAISERISRLEQEYQELADHLHRARQDYTSRLAEAVRVEMGKLNMPEAAFLIYITQQPLEHSFVRCDGQPVKPTAKGYDQVEFYLSANPGEKPKPLAEIASGGEISRIMLAIKIVFQRNDPVGALVFDEIDSGISGIAAEKVADGLAKLARNKQVICITHLPQIAARAAHHLHVEKKIVGGETSVTLRYLTPDERVRVIAQLFSGSEIPPETYQSLRQMIDTAHG
jgi:DNA repair protein RecN (Recombination protein N)